MADIYLEQLQEQVSEIEKRLKGLSLTITASAKLDAIEALLAEVDTTISLFSEIFNSYIITNDRFNDGLSTQIEENQETISSLQSQLETLQLALESSGNAGGGGGTETTNSYVEYIQKVGINFRSAFYTEKIYLYTETTEKVRIKATISGTGTTNSGSPFCALFFNNQIIETHYMSYANSYTQEFEYDFYTNDNVNSFYFQAYNGPNHGITNIKWEIWGRNPYVLNFEDRDNILMFNNTYYITQINEGKIKYLIQTPETLNLSATPNEVTISDYFNEPYFDAIVFPKYTSTSGVISLQPNYSFYAVLNNNFVYGDIIDGVFAEKGVKSFYVPFSTLKISGTKDMGAIASYVNPADKKPTYINIRASAQICQINNAEIQGDWANSVLVTNIYLNDGCPDNLDYGMVAQREDRVNFYIPSINANYMVEIGLGTNVTAFYHPDTSITIYMNRFGKLIKYLLRVNDETLQYEIDTQMAYTGMSMYYEAYDNKGLARINGVLTVVDALT